MHESEAKALVKGAYRKSEQRYNNLYGFDHYLMDQGYYRKKFSCLKDTFGYIEKSAIYFGDFLIEAYQIGKLTTKHKIVELLAIEPELNHVDGIGEVSKLICRQFNTRKMLKGSPNLLNVYQSNFYFEKHFLQRAVQRLDISRIGDIGKRIFPLMLWFIQNNISTRGMTDSLYIVFQNFVLVAMKVRNEIAIVFKTLLIKEVFSKEQQVFFKHAYDELKNNDFIIIDQNGHIIKKVIQHFDNYCIHQYLDKPSYWFQHILKHRTIGQKKTVADKFGEIEHPIYQYISNKIV